MSLSLYFLRHGETIYSRSGGFCGELDPELTPCGHQMAEAFAATYSTQPWTAVFASPMQRTIATATPLCQAIGMEMQLRDGLKEINYGAWEGQTQEFVKQHYLDEYIRWMTEPAWNAPTGGETAVQIASRSALVIAEIEQKYTSGNVLVVSHKATIRIMLCSLLGIDLGRYRDRINALAGSVSIVKFGEHGPLLEVLGDRHYMGDSLRNLPGT
ncbi:MAG: histidine phosphatase family protein [Scytolyngbya sp. HA4215-MV1]|jgi:probable phosphoglycerate mutase|nr:histidine phosphatase family protein [Scytolyngbya sp. HA4215-MV1]